jgi:hypothetical protein
MKPGHTILNENVFEINNTLEIKQVKKEHEGVYLCKGTNNFGSTITALSMRVKTEGEQQTNLISSHHVQQHITIIIITTTVIIATTSFIIPEIITIIINTIILTL